MSNADPDDFDSLWEERKPKPTPGPAPEYRITHEATPYGAAALAGELERLGAATEGTRNDTLNEAAFNLAMLVASGHLPGADTEHALRTVALHVGLTPSETEGTLRSAFGAGMLHPRVVADLDQPASPYDLGPADGPTDDQKPHDDQANQPGAAESFLRDRYKPLIWMDLWADASVEEWIVEPLLPARRLVALFSAPKVGKSLLLLEMAVAISTGAKVLGVVPDRPRRVLYIDFENDPRGDIRTRLQAMRVQPDDLTDLLYLSYPPLPKLDTQIGGLELLAVVDLFKVEVVVIDTISRAVKGEENDNDTWLAFYRHTGLLLKANGTACIRLDHTGKDATKGMRGGSAKYGDVDAAWSMTATGTNTFVLTCVANRLPIDQKTLVLHRETVPGLHHRVDPAGRIAAENAKADGLVRFLDHYAGPDKPLSVEEARALCDLHTEKASRQDLMVACRFRKQRIADAEEAAEKAAQDERRYGQ